MAVATETELVLQIGEAAGLVWRTLAAQGPLSYAKLVKATGAPRDAVMQAVGWLAREDKLEFEDGRTPKVGLK
jgi:hypothetical protein